MGQILGLENSSISQKNARGGALVYSRHPPEIRLTLPPPPFGKDFQRGERPEARSAAS